MYIIVSTVVLSLLTILLGSENESILIPSQHYLQSYQALLQDILTGTLAFGISCKTSIAISSNHAI